jgi:hypothetical protein
MLPTFLQPEILAREDGTGPAFPLERVGGGVLLLTLGITRTIEQQSLDISVWGSPDGKNWGTKPLLALPQKFYCGTYSIMLDLAQHADVNFLRVQWKMNRWGRGEPSPLFGFYVAAEAMKAQAVGSFA